MGRNAIKYKIKKSTHLTMTISEYAKSKYYLGKVVKPQRIHQLIKDNVLRLWRKNPVMVFADKIDRK